MINFFKFALGATLLMVVGCTKINENRSTTEMEVDVEVDLTEFKVVEFLPAPGQFVNEGYAATTMAEACQYAQRRLNNRYFVSLGGFGGYIVVKSKAPIANSGDYDFGIYDNAFSTSSEPGVVWVSQDSNENGIADDEWYELYGSDSDKDTVVHNYSITYSRNEDNTIIAWSDNKGGSGTIERNATHQQDYFPAWITEKEYTLCGTLLPDNSEWSDINQEWNLLPFEWGYADNFSREGRTSDKANLFRISDARNAKGERVELEQIDFIKVQSATNAVHTPIGETSTEVCGFTKDL